MDLTSIRPSNLGICAISYTDIFNGKINVPMPIHQQGVLKAVQEICLKEGNNKFIPLNPKKISAHLKKTSIAQYMPQGDITPDINIMISRGWLSTSANNENSVVLTDYAKQELLKLKIN